MADLVVGMARSVLDGALTKAQAAIEEEAKLRQSAQRNLVFITGEFQMMQSFLRVANGERLENRVVRTWVWQIRDLAYDVEDCIEFVVHLDKRNRWWARLLEPFRWVVPRCLPPLELDEAVAELERLKSRVDDVSARNSRYSLISDSGSKPAAAEQQSASMDAVCATAFDRLIIAAGTKKASLTHVIPKEAKGDLRVISVWGSGGGNHGITPVLWDAYMDKETCVNFTCRAWVKLRRPFNSHEFVQSLMTQFIAATCQEQGDTIVALDVANEMEANQGNLLAKFANYISENRFLVVLEDVSTIDEWNALAMFFPKKDNGSCIILSMLDFEVASLLVGHPYRVLHLNQLSPQHSVYAFYKTGSQHGGHKGKVEAAKKWKEQNRLVGRDTEIKALEQHVVLACVGSYQVMSVWGIAGVGKSALLKYFFCERITCSRRFYKKYAWVDLSHPFNLSDFARRLLLSFDSEDIETKGNGDHDTMGSKNPIVECREMLKKNQHRCLIVIDDLQLKEEWDLLLAELLPEWNKKIFIIVIASEESIATHCCGPSGPYKYNVKGLESKAAFDLFREVSGKETSSDGDVKVLQELVSKCGGLPQLIVEIAKLIAKRTIGWMDRARSISNEFIKELSSNGEFGELKGLFCWMQSYFRNCPDFLKPCIFYLSIFCPNQLIRRRRLVRRWIAEGYSRDNNKVSAEEYGEKQFLNLLSLSIIRKPSSVELDGTKMVSCQVNGFFREYVISQQMEEDLVFELDDSCVITTQRTGRHLVISESWFRDKIVFDSIDFSKLRSLTVSGEWESFFISESMKLLRVVDLEDASKIKYGDLKNIVKWFPRLKFLSLRGHTEICRLPSSVGDLRQLQTLDVRHTSIVTLPVNICKIQNLQYIRAGKAPADNKPSTPQAPLAQSQNQQIIGVGSTAPTDHKPSTSQAPSAQIHNQQNIGAVSTAPTDHKPSTPQLQNQQYTAAVSTAPADHKPSTAQLPLSWLSDYCKGRHLVGVEMPPGIGKLTALHTLGVVNVTASGAKSFLEDLKMLTQLRKLGVSGINKNNSKKFFSALKVLVHLESFSVRLDKGNGSCFEDIELPLKNLVSLKMQGLGDKLPKWSQQLTKITKIDLEMAQILQEREEKLTEEDAKAQGKSLKDLKIEKQGCMKFLGRLPELCILRIRAKQFEDDKLNVSVVDNDSEDKSFEKLKILEIGCSSDSTIKFGSKTLKTLEQLKVDCSTRSKYKFEGLNYLIELREVLLKGSNDSTLEEDLKNQLRQHRKKPVVKKLDRSNYSSATR